MAKKVKLTANTPKVTFIHCNITRPDSKYGNYKTQGHFASKDDAMEVVGKIKELIEKAGKKPGKVTFEDTKRKSGCKRMLIGGLGTKIYKTTDDTYYIDASSDYIPEVFNVKGEPYPEDALPIIGGGSTGKLKVGFSYNEDNGSVSCFLKAAQVIGFVKVGGFDDASDDVEEGEITEAIATQRGRDIDEDDEDDEDDTPSDEDGDDDEEDQDW